MNQRTTVDRADAARPIDPVCGMAVDPASAAGSWTYEGRTYYFCNVGCLEKFRADPQRYLRGTPGQAAPQTAPGAGGYTCPMHPEVRQERPGACPECGMALEPVSGAALPTRVEYTCPMHPQVVRNEPGSCPICGMALEPRTVTVEEGPNPELVDMSRRFWVASPSVCRSS